MEQPSQPQGAVETLQDREQYRSVWRCPVCNALNGYTYRTGRITCLRIFLGAGVVNFLGDGDYTCPRCGSRVIWRAAADQLARLMASIARTR